MFSQALPFLVFVFFSHLRKAAAISVKTILSSSCKLRQYETKAREGECARMVNFFLFLSLCFCSFFVFVFDPKKRRTWEAE